MQTFDHATAFGLPVLRDQPTPSPIKDRLGRPVLWQQTRMLTLQDGSTAYGCAHCDYVSRAVLSIRPHLKKHLARTNGAALAGDLKLSDVVRHLASLEGVTADRDRWRERARTAERALAKMRKALETLGAGGP
jgi:hypothetical protein